MKKLYHKPVQKERGASGLTAGKADTNRACGKNVVREKKVVDSAGKACYNIKAVKNAVIAQQVERILGKDEVPGSNPGNSSMKKALKHKRFKAFLFLTNPVPFAIWRPFGDRNGIFLLYARFASIVSRAEAAFLSLSSKA